MSHDYHAGVHTSSTWHRLETVAPMTTAADMIAVGEQSGAWPVSLASEDLRTESGLVVPGSSVVGRYYDGSRIAYGAVGGRHTALDPAEWRETIRAAVDAGARPDGAFSLDGGRRLVACLSIGHDATDRFRQYLTLTDDYAGRHVFEAGSTSVRTVCANTVALFRSEGRGSNARIRHTRSINDRVARMRNIISEHIESGEALRALYDRAVRTDLSRDDTDRILDVLFPPAAEDASKRAKTLAETRRQDAVKAMARRENREGSSLATIWNGATWTVDRTPDGLPKKTRGGRDRISAMLDGSRGDRVEEIRTMVETLMADGSVQSLTASEAVAHGVDERQVGASLLSDMLG